MLRKALKLPCYAVIFSSIRTEGDVAAYEEAAERMMERVQDQPGFLGVETASGEGGLGMTVSYWDSLDSIAAWRAHAEHSQVRTRGRSGWYGEYRLRVCKVERETSFP